MATVSAASGAALLVAEGRQRIAADARAAREVGKRALAAARAQSDASAETDALLLLGECDEMLSEYGEALAHFDAALAMASAAADRRREADAHRLAASIHNHLGSLDEAMEHHLLALGLLEEAGDDVALAHALRAVGVTASKSKDYERALAWYAKSLALSRRIGDDDATSKTLNNIGIDLKNLGRLEESRSMLEEAIVLLDRMGKARGATLCRSNLALTFELMHRYTEAEETYATVIADNRSRGDVRSLANALAGYGRLCSRLGRLDEARAKLQEGLEHAERVSILPDVANILEMLWKVEKEAGNHREALAAYERFHDVTRGILQEDSLRRMKALELRLKLGEAEREAREERQRSRQLDELVEELRKRQEAAESANVAKSRFLAAASHDLRQPTHALGLFLQALRQRTLPAPERELVDKIGKSFSAMEALFNALLDVSRLDAGVVEAQPCTFPVARMLERMRAEYAPQAAAKGLRFSVRPCGAFVVSDPVLLEEMVGNLVSNAVRHTARGRVLLGCRRRGDSARIEVWDTGRGIPADKQREVFGEFVQLENPERDRRKGLGLGLAIVDRLSKLLGHAVELRSEPGRGSVFSVLVPAGRAADVVEEEASEPSRTLDPFAGRFVAIVDDDPDVLEAMSSLLRDWRLEVVTADSRGAILAKLAGASRVPQAILCDYRLRGDENGIEVIRAIREEFNEEIPAALVTGDTDPLRLQDARQSGLPLVHKPLKPAQLRALLSQLLRPKGFEAFT